MTIFRVLRDEDFLRQMLVLIRRFHTTYVKAKRAPPVNMFFDRSDYQVGGVSLPTGKIRQVLAKPFGRGCFVTVGLLLMWWSLDDGIVWPVTVVG